MSRTGHAVSWMRHTVSRTEHTVSWMGPTVTTHGMSRPTQFGIPRPTQSISCLKRELDGMYRESDGVYRSELDGITGVR